MRAVVPVLLICLVGSVCFAQQPPQPTEAHKYLTKDEGVWKGTMKLFMPGQDPIAMPVKETNKMFGNGLWLLSEFDAGPFQGRGQFGYDSQKKKYTGTWIDNMNPYMSVMEGDFDVEKMQMVMQFKGMDTATGKLQDMKSVMTMQGEDKRTFVMYAKNGGDWQKAFEIDYERAE